MFGQRLEFEKKNNSKHYSQFYLVCSCTTAINHKNFEAKSISNTFAGKLSLVNFFDSRTLNHYNYNNFNSGWQPCSEV